MAYNYNAFGLSIQSQFPLPNLVPGTTDAPSVFVRKGSLDRPPSDSFEGLAFSRSTEAEAYYYVKDIGGVLARRGRDLIADPLPGLAEGGFHNLISGIGLGLILHQRGIFSLHASAVSIDGGVVGFVGWKGMGKSTTAGAFHRRGHRVVTDDVLALFGSPEGVMVLPGYPSLKLWPDSVTAVGHDPDMLPQLHPLAEKRALTVLQGFETAPLPLRALYVLDYAEEAEELQIQKVTPREGCVELLRHSFAHRILGDAAATATHLSTCARLANRVPMRRLVRVRELDALPNVLNQVQEDLLELSVPLETAA